MPSSVEIRADLVHALRLDLVGPEVNSPLKDESLDTPPSRWYLTGFLVPTTAGESQKFDEQGDEEVGTEGGSVGADDGGGPDPTAAKNTPFPSSMGLSFFVPAEATQLEVKASWGDYVYDDANRLWKRTPRLETKVIDLPRQTPGTVEIDVPHAPGVFLALLVRPVNSGTGVDLMLPKGTRSVSVFLVNRRPPAGVDFLRDTAFLFQAALEVLSEVAFVARPNLAGLHSTELDDQIADLQYADCPEFAVGHGVATEAPLIDGICRALRTLWVPTAEVERVEATSLTGVELSMEALALLADGADAQAKLGPLVDLYKDWLDKVQAAPDPTHPTRVATKKALLSAARAAAIRMQKGIDVLADPKVLEAFKLANKTMAQAARQRFGVMQGKDPATVATPSWRPFQLAFLLLNLPGIVDPLDADREIVDLLFFPTGGGKTEAYLGLAAFTILLRRLRTPGPEGVGLAVLMRYTLRLLTLDQLGRAATLICALELERQANAGVLGDWPFEIGLWVGQAATPNVMGKSGDNNERSARKKTIAYKANSSRPSPIPIEECPWCGEKFTSNSFELHPTTDAPLDLRIRCVNRRCPFTRNSYLPILAVDEPIYRRIPCFLIATVDKFAAMPWTGQVGAFFGKVDRKDGDGFYGPADSGKGSALPVSPLPPDLIIQDELHLISGPMGTIVGLYESALDKLCTRMIGDKVVRPKIVASTATARRADDQVRALFTRQGTQVFPPPLPDRRKTFFSETVPSSSIPARVYVGIAAQGRSPKVIMLRTYLAMLGASQKAYEDAGGKKAKDNPADPYMTLLGYFNSLRELGGARRIIEDEITARLRKYQERKREGEPKGVFTNRTIAYEVVELTSRVTTDKVAAYKRRLAKAFPDDEAVHVAIATNMISVGLDIPRLGLMVVFGQPKTTAEYIQATSRVGREKTKPGLVVTMLNIHKARDRSHYERFGHYHTTFYRSVEATSVTPFSPRALDRGLAGTVVGLARHGMTEMTAPKGAGRMLDLRSKLDWVVTDLGNRARAHANMSATESKELADEVEKRVKDLLDEWTSIAKLLNDKGGTALQYQSEVGDAQRLLHPFLDPDLNTMNPKYKKFRANRSMRDVEPDVNLWLATMDGQQVDAEEGD